MPIRLPVSIKAPEDYVFSVSVIDGKKPKSSTGMLDPRIFTKENRLRAIFDSEARMWYLKYDKGAVPPSLNQKFTNINKLISFITPYFKSRNVQIEDITGNTDGSR